MVGMSVDFLSLIERGRNSPSFEKLELMARALKFPLLSYSLSNRDQIGHAREKEARGREA